MNLPGNSMSKSPYSYEAIQPSELEAATANNFNFLNVSWNKWGYDDTDKNPLTRKTVTKEQN